MIFKILSEDVVSQGLFFAQDQERGHESKVAPRTTFFIQGFAAILGTLTQASDPRMLGHIHNVCSYNRADDFNCPNGRILFSSSVIWALIGPARLYSAVHFSSGLLHFFSKYLIAEIAARPSLIKVDYWRRHAYNYVADLGVQRERQVKGVLAQVQLAFSLP